MERPHCILLYSKYSNTCTNMLSALQECPVSNQIGLRPICIDNEQIRSRIMKAKKIEIKIVPCILIVHTHGTAQGTIEKYEGENAIEWVEERIKLLMPHPSQSIPSIPSIPTLPTVKYSEPDNSQGQKKKRVTDEEEFTDDSSEESPPPRKRKNKKSQRNQKREKQSNSTKIDELEDVEEEEEIETERPPVGLRNGPGGYDMQNFGQQQELNRDGSKHVRPSQSSSKGDLMSTAMEMQKQREMLDSQNPRGGIDPATTKRPI